MGKRKTLLYLDADLVHRAKQSGMNMSQRVNEYLDIILNQRYAVAEQAKLHDLTWEKNTTERDIKELEERLTFLKTRLEQLNGDLVTQKVAVEKAIRSEKIAELLQQVNQIIEMADYDIVASWEAAQEAIGKIEEYGRKLDYEWFERQVERLKTIYLDKRGGDMRANLPKRRR